MFLEVDSRGTWSYKGNKLFWTADDGSTGILEVVAQEEVDEFIKKQWYRQDTPSGIPSLHKFIQKTHLGVSRPDIKRFVDKQETWQLLKPLPTQSKRRAFTNIPKRPFQIVELDTADMISFGQTSREDAYNYISVCVDIFSGFCMAEVQEKNNAKQASTSFRKMLAAIKTLGYDPPRLVKTDQGIEYMGPDWKRLDKKHGWNRIHNKNYPAVHAERKIRTLKKYIALNSQLNYGDATKWWNVVTTSVKAVNNIFHKKGGAPVDIIRMDLQERRNITNESKRLQQKAQENMSWRPRKQEPQVGDSIRVRIASSKQLPRDYKSHLPYDKNGLPSKWSTDLHRVEKKRVNRTTGAVRLYAAGRWLFWPGEVLQVPADTEPSAVWGRDGNVDYVAPKIGRRNPKRLRKRPVRHGDFVPD